MKYMDIDSYIKDQAEQSGSRLFSDCISDEVNEFITANESFQNIDIGQRFEPFIFLFWSAVLMGYAVYLLSL